MLTVTLLGPPSLHSDDPAVRPPRGRKAWVLLAYIVLAERSPTRRELAEGLFGEADDPLGALRWSLAELRRALQLSESFTGDPVVANLPSDVHVDAVDLLAGSIDPKTLLAGSGEFLEGVELTSSPDIESWLAVERQRVSSAMEARFHQTAISLLASGNAADAVPYARLAVASNPLEEGNHELLVRSLAMAGDSVAARQQVAQCQALLRAELDIEPSEALIDAAESTSPSSMVLPLSGRAAALSQIDAGRAAIVAGAIDAGVQCLRRAVAEAISCQDRALQARALAALGGALVHAVRGRDEEGALLLLEAAAMAQQVGDRATAVVAYRELGFVDVQSGRRVTADDWLARAAAEAETDEEFAAILGVKGMNASDSARYPQALEFLGQSADRAHAGGDQRQQAWSLSLIARAHLLRGEMDQARSMLSHCMELVQQQRWLAFLPWPQALEAELNRQMGMVDEAADAFEQAWMLACQLNDPCWEGMAARGLGMVNADRGDDDKATNWLGEAARRCNRVPDRYQWVRAYVMDAAITTAIEQDDAVRARPLISTLSTLAARCSMDEFLVRAHVHQFRADGAHGESVLTTARGLAAHIDNPALDALIPATTHE